MTITLPPTAVPPCEPPARRPSAQEVLKHLGNVVELHREARLSLTFMDPERARTAMAMATAQLVPCWVALEPLLPPPPLNLTGEHRSRMSLDFELPDPDPWTGLRPYASDPPKDLAGQELSSMFERLKTQVTDVSNPLKAGPPLDLVGDAFEVLVRSHVRAAKLVARIPTPPVLNALAARRRADAIAVTEVGPPSRPQEIPAGVDFGDLMRAYARDVFAVLVEARPVAGTEKVLTAAERRLWQELDLAAPELVAQALQPMQATHLLRRWKPREVESLHDAIRAARGRR